MGGPAWPGLTSSEPAPEGRAQGRQRRVRPAPLAVACWSHLDYSLSERA
jgi:hypothetical protein